MAHTKCRSADDVVRWLDAHEHQFCEAHPRGGIILRGAGASAFIPARFCGADLFSLADFASTRRLFTPTYSGRVALAG